MQFFYIQNRQICLSKKILYQYIVVVFFCPAWDSFSSENSFESLHSAKNLIKENVNHSCLFKPEMWNNRRSVY